MQSDLAALSKTQAKVKKNQILNLNPELKQLKEKATSKWFSLDHMKENLKKLKQMTMNYKQPGILPSDEEFCNPPRFCMLFVNYYNGARRQAAEILTNSQVC